MLLPKAVGANTHNLRRLSSFWSYPSIARTSDRSIDSIHLVFLKDSRYQICTPKFDLVVGGVGVHVSRAREQGIGILFVSAGQPQLLVLGLEDPGPERLLEPQEVFVRKQILHGGITESCNAGNLE